MRIYNSFEDAVGIKNPVVTTGSFDGVHIGHKTILGRLKMLSEKYSGESVLVTFDPHPRKVLYPDTVGKNLKFITSQEEKLELLRKAGLDNVIIVKFTREFSKITSEQFVKDYLHGILKAKVIVVGFNHHFGFNQEGDYRQLWNLREKYSFDAEEIPEQEVQHETVSSSRIREAIKAGYIMRANAYLDHYYIVMGKPEIYDYRNTELEVSLYKMPLNEENKLLPAPGIYAVSFESGNHKAKGMSVINRITGDECEVLLSLFDIDQKIVGHRSTVFFHKRIHGSVDLNDFPLSARRIKKAMDEIEELIY